MSDGRRPLEGIRVLELASIVAGPFCGALMAEFGAEVIKTELPGKGDDLRRLGPSEGDCTYWWSVDNRNKKVMTLDLHHPRAQDIVRQLVPLCDVVIENFRPGVLERWHLGWDDLSRLNPRLVMARVTAFGQTGPRRQGPGFAAIGSAFGGTWYLNGYADRPPARPTPVYPDYLTGLFTAFGVLTALRHRDATGEGQWIAWPGGACQTKDGRWVVFTAPAQHLFERLCTMIGQPELPRAARFATAAERTAHMPELTQLMEAWCAAHTFEDVAHEFEVYQVPYAPLMSMADIFAEPHYREREMIIDVPESTLGSIPQPGVVPKLSRTPGRVTHAGPALGQHTEEILTGLLGLSAGAIAELRQQGVI